MGSYGLWNVLLTVSLSHNYPCIGHVSLQYIAFRSIVSYFVVLAFPFIHKLNSIFWTSLYQYPSKHLSVIGLRSYLYDPAYPSIILPAIIFLISNSSL